MPTARANGIDIEYETFGAADAPPLLLIMGLACQMIAWDDEFCGMLAQRGHRVIRFDNRDIGLSTKTNGDSNVLAAISAAIQGQPFTPPYTLSDMAADTVGLLDALDVRSAHIVGASLGGMIAQTIAIEHPARVRTLTSIMSTTGSRTLPTAKPEVTAVLMTPAPPDREGNIQRAINTFRTIGSPGFPFDEERVRRLAGRSYDRCFEPTGPARQLIAILAAHDREPALAQLKMPTLVIHGSDDPLIPVEGGRATAKAIPGSELLVVEGMGHDFPRQVWPRIIDAISTHTTRN